MSVMHLMSKPLNEGRRRWDEVYAVFLWSFDLVLGRNQLGNDGLTDDERNADAARYADAAGRPPARSAERTERLRAAAAKMEGRPRPRHREPV